MNNARKLIMALAIVMPSLALAALSYMMLRGLDSLPFLEQDRSPFADAKSMARAAAILSGLAGLFLGFGYSAISPALRKKPNPETTRDSRWP